MNKTFHNSVFWILSINSQGVRPCWQAELSQYKGDNCDSDQIEHISWERSYQEMGQLEEHVPGSSKALSLILGTLQWKHHWFKHQTAKHIV